MRTRAIAIGIGALLLLTAAGAWALQPAPRSNTAGVFTIAGERFTPDEIVDARAVPDLAGSSAILITFAEPASKRLATLTRAHLGQPVAFALDGKTLMSPVVRDPIEGGTVEIASPLPVTEAEALAKRISGKDPVPEELAE